MASPPRRTAPRSTNLKASRWIEAGLKMRPGAGSILTRGWRATTGSIAASTSSGEHSRLAAGGRALPSRLRIRTGIMSKQRIFISGVAGFLGSHLADAFLADGHEVVGNDNMVGGYPDTVPEGGELARLDF